MDLGKIYSNEKDRITFLKGLIRLAKSDGVFGDEQREFFRNTALGLGITESNIVDLEGLFTSDINSPDFLIKFDTKQKALFFLENAVQLCTIDGEYLDCEKQEIRKIAKELNISLDSVEKIESWVEDGVQWQKRGDELLGLES